MDSCGFMRIFKAIVQFVESLLLDDAGAFLTNHALVLPLFGTHRFLGLPETILENGFLWNHGYLSSYRSTRWEILLLDDVVQY